MRLTATRSSITSGGGAVLDPIQQEDPSLDLNFAENKVLRDDVDSNNPVTFTRASSATYVGADGLIKTSPVNLLQYSERFDEWTAGSNTTVTSNVVTAPDGTQTADRVNNPATGSTFVGIGSVTAGTTYTASVWAKAVTPGTNNTFTFNVGGGSSSNASSQFTATDQWQRFTFTVTPSTVSASPNNNLFINNEGDSFASDVYFWGAQLEEGSTATDYIPTTSTISGAPRFDHDPVTGESLGLLIEEARTNLVPNSNLWNNNSSIVSVTTGQSSPDGGTNAVRVESSSTSPGSPYVGISGAINSGDTLSVFVKPDEVTKIWLSGAFAAPNLYASFDFDTLQVSPGSDALNAKMEPYPNGWYRCSFTANVSAPTFSIGIILDYAKTISLPSDAQVVPVGSGVYTFGAQREQGSFPTSYIPTNGSTVTRAADVAEITGANFAKTNLQPYSNNFTGAEWTFDGNGTAYATFSADISPSGETDAWTLTTDAGAYITASAFTANNLGFGNRKATFDLTNQTVTTQANVISASITALSNGWFRCFYQPTLNADHVTSVHVKPGSGDTFSIEHYVSSNRLSTEGSGTVLIYGMQVEEGSVATDYTPSVESFVSRASSATYVDDTTGLIKTTPVNHLTYSQDFSQWSTAAGSVQTNYSTAPDGTNTGALITSTGGGVYQTNSTSGLRVASAYFKNLTNDVRFGQDGGGVQARVYFSPTFDIVSQDANVVSVSFEDAANGWTRVTVVSSVDVTALTIYGYSSQSFEVWGAQLEEGSTATPYIKTTSTISGAARYENGELLLEEARTNHVKDSEDLTSFRWSNTGDTLTRTANQISAPDGTTTADKIAIPSGSGEKGLQSSALTGTSSGIQITSSCFCKAAEHSYVRVEMQGGGNTVSVNVDLSDGSLISQVNSPDSYAIEAYPNDWYRISVTSTTASTSASALRVYMVDASGNTSFTGTIGNGVYLWGGQHEVGGFASSYISTAATAVTRAADVSTSALGVDSWYNQDEGTVFAEANCNGLSNNNSVSFVGHIYSSTASSYVDVLRYQPDARAGTVESGTTSASLNTGLAIGSVRKSAHAFKQDDFALSVDGFSVLTDTSGNLGTHNVFAIGNDATGNRGLNGHIKRLSYFKTRLPNATLQDITTPPPLPLSFLEYVTTASTSSFTLLSTGTVNYEVNWGDGTIESLTTNNPTHTYSSAGEYTIRITPADGSTYRPYFNDAVSDTSIESVSGTGGSQLGNSLLSAWRGASNMTSFSGDIDTSSVTIFNNTWRDCSSLTSFPLIDTSSATDLRVAWRGCSSLTSFPLIDTSSSTTFFQTWTSCSSLTSFPQINTAAGINFNRSWFQCSSLTSFPLIDTSSGTNFNQSWRDCTSLTSFPANMFDTTGTLVSTAFINGWLNCALTAQSIENILVSLDTNGASNITLSINGGTNAAKTTWSTAANTAYTNLINKGWTISYNA